ncbi:hypothetical protein KIN20_035264 [Parelaphostrongylus tenuis]|uniref:Uncharacterized protein n=1 Tax=Parelaphostrongylus tenuis TaxID=148309 RepID=A0AAD5WKA7_PARTN|nr:hypothetical protein KIN20_035264 [Parelaphostrongylus tenuis]
MGDLLTFRLVLMIAAVMATTLLPSWPRPIVGSSDVKTLRISRFFKSAPSNEISGSHSAPTLGCTVTAPKPLIEGLTNTTRQCRGHKAVILEFKESCHSSTQLADASKLLLAHEMLLQTEEVIARRRQISTARRIIQQLPD